MELHSAKQPDFNLHNYFDIDGPFTYPIPIIRIPLCINPTGNGIFNNQTKSPQNETQAAAVKPTEIPHFSLPLNLK